MLWQEIDHEESQSFLISEIEELDPNGFYKNILSDNGFVDLIYEITNRQWDWSINELQDFYSAEITSQEHKFYAENKNKYFALASAYLDALYFHKDR